jgi:tRNA(Ile)-lysidine synthetase-like protein
MILAEVERWLASVGVLRSGEERVLVACSGGRDSVVLAHATVEVLGARRVVLGHVDHRVRPDSGSDARFVEALADRLGATVVVDAVSPLSDAEAELRRVRYQALESQRQRSDAVVLMTAHTRDDQAETLMLQLLRETELVALDGIARHRDRILRPLLDVPRAEVAAHAAAHQLSWREDPTNLEPRYLRNRIRKELLPLIESRYRARFSERLAELTRIRAPASNVPAPIESAMQNVSVSMRSMPWSGGPIPDGVRGAAFDADVLICPAIRTLRPGDKIRPFGMKGRTKVAEVLRAAGVPPEARAHALLVVDDEDRVLWVPGVVRSAEAPVQDGTKRVWMFEVRDNAVLQPAERRVTLEAAGEGPGHTPVSE